MECNKDEAKRAMNIALKKLSENDYIGAKKLVVKAQSLYSHLDGSKQVLAMINVYISASSNREGNIDFYEILGVDPMADDERLKRHYKKLALLIHPDKNKCKEAEGAFKLVLEAWSTLSDKANRLCYDQKRKSKEASTGAQKQPNPHKPATSSETHQKAKHGVDPSRKARKKYKPWSKDSSNEKKGGLFWTMCNRCKIHCAYPRNTHVNKAICCSNCGQTFIATEKNPWPSSSSHPQQQQWSSQDKATSDASSSSTTSAQEKLKRWFKESQENLDAAANAAAARENANKAERPFKKPMTTDNQNSTFEAERLFKSQGNANATQEAERLFKKPMTTENPNSTSEAKRLFKSQGNANSTEEAERLFKRPMTTENQNSTQEAERLFKKPMTTENPNSTFEAERLFKRQGNANSTFEAERLFKRPMGGVR